jgi:hypothetical protein
MLWSVLLFYGRSDLFFFIFCTSGHLMHQIRLLRENRPVMPGGMRVFLPVNRPAFPKTTIRDHHEQCFLRAQQSLGSPFLRLTGTTGTRQNKNGVNYSCPGPCVHEPESRIYEEDSNRKHTNNMRIFPGLPEMQANVTRHVIMMETRAG